jgi:hypothetical protein
MPNGLKLKGGQASTGPHKINPMHTVMTRQRKRREHFKNAFKQLAKGFGGFTARGGHYWPEGMTRRIARQISRDGALAEG